MESSESFVVTLTDWIEIFMRRSMRNFILYAKQNGYSLTQIAVLFLIHHKGTSSVSDIGDELEITNPAASQMLERLVQLQLIQRVENPHDRRFKQIALTDKGHQVLQESINARQSWFGDLARALSNSEKGQIVTALNIMIDTTNRLNPNPD
jgi:DNA-binding MarR family transcriptional regulator